MASVESGAFRPLLSFGDTDDVLIDFTQRFGQWSHGTYLKGYSKTHQKNVMVKVIDTAKFPLPKSSLDLEIAFHQRFQSSQYVLKMLEHKYLNTNLTIALEICNKGNLRDYLRQTGPIPEEKATSLLLQIIYGLKGLHDMNFSHGALCPENILINEENGKITLKLSTFTYARHYTSEIVNKSEFVSDLKYMPLEFLKSSKYNLKSDFWSLGIIYYQMLYGTTPWTGANLKKLEENIFNKPLEFPTNDEISQTSVNFLSHCLQRDLDKRMDWSDLMQNRLVSRALFSQNDGYFQLLNQGSPQKNLKSNKGTPASSPARNNKYYFSSRSLVIPSKPALNNSFRRQQTFELSTSFRDKDNSVSSYRDEYEKKKQINQSAIITNTNRSSSMTPKKESPKAQLSMICKGSSLREQSFREHSFQSFRDQSFRDASPTVKTNSNNASFNLKGTRFYDSFVAKTNVSKENIPIKKFPTPTTPMQKNPGFAAVALGLDKQCKWLASKADILGETYQMIAHNSELPLHKKINRILKKESDKMQGIIGTQEKTTRMTMDIQERIKTLPGSSKTQMTSTRNPKFVDSMAKKQKSKEIYELLEEITAALLKFQKIDSKTETMIKIAANLKVLREFDEIGQNVVKELKSLKDILLVFYRKKDFTHVKYLLLVKNYV